MAAASGVVRDVCSGGPPWHTAEDLLQGLKQGDEATRLLFHFFSASAKKRKKALQLRKAIASEDKRLVGVPIEKPLGFSLSMRYRAVPYQETSKSLVAIERSRWQRCILPRSGLARISQEHDSHRCCVRTLVVLVRVCINLFVVPVVHPQHNPLLVYFAPHCLKPDCSALLH